MAATGLSALSSLVAESSKEGGATDGRADALAHCAGTSPACDLGASTFALISVVVSKTGCGLSKGALREDVTVDRQLNHVAATSSSTPYCSIVQGVTESIATDDGTDALAHSPSMAPPSSLGALALGFDSMVVSEACCALGGTTLKTVTVERRLTQVVTTDSCAPSCSIAEGVPQGGAMHGGTDTLAPCASIAPPCGLGALVFGFDSAVVSGTGVDLGNVSLWGVETIQASS